MSLYVESGYVEENYTSDDVFIFWDTKIIFVPKNYLTPTTNPNIFNLDTDDFRLKLKDLEDGEIGISYPDTHQHNTEVPLGGVIYARVIEIINGYTVTFEDGQYSVNLFGSNNNIGDVVNVNQVSVRTNNAAGLIVDPGISESLDYGEHIIYNADTGSAGSSWPVGTYASPVNNCSDLQLLLTKYGRSEVLCLSNITLTQDFDDTAFITKTGDEKFYPNGFRAHDCNFHKFIIEGDFNHSKIFATECSFNDVYNIGGTIFSSILFGDIKLSTQYQLVLNKCSSTKPGITPVIIDMVEGIDTIFGTRGHSGPIVLDYCDTSASTASLIFEAGDVVLNNTCSNGNIVLGGIASVEDNSGSGCTVNITGVIDPDTSNNMAYNNQVNLKANSGFSGTDFPLGTLGKPVNNITDAIAIANIRGIDTIHVHNNWTFVAGTFLNDFIIEGDSIQKTTLTFEDTAILLNSTVRNAKVTGDITGIVWFDGCHIIDAGSTNPNPSTQDIIITKSLMDGTVSLTPSYSGSVKMLDCYSGVPGSRTPIFNIANANTDFFIRNYSGGMKIINSNQPLNASIDMLSGNVIIDETVSGGTFTIRGISNITNNSTGSAIIKSTGLLEPERVNTLAYVNQVHLMTGSTISGTVFPAGTSNYPVNNLADAVAIGNARGINNIHIMGDYTFINGTYISNLTIYGEGSQTSIFTFEPGCILAFCEIHDAKCTGAETGIVGFTNCLIEDLGSVGLAPSSVEVITQNCFFKGVVTLPSNYSGQITAIDCWGLPDDLGNPPLIDMGNSTADVQIRNWSGLVQFANVIHNIDVRGFFVSGGAILDESITAGNFLFAGVGILEDYSIGTAVVDYSALINEGIITEAVWDEPLVNHVTDGTTGRILSLTAFSGKIWLSDSIGVSGTTFPIGTRAKPSSVGADALAIAQRENITEFNLDGTFIATQSISGYTIGGDTWLDDKFILNGAHYDELSFKNLHITGNVGSFGDNIEFINCYIKDVYNFSGELVGCRTFGTITVGSGQTLSGVALVSEGDYTIIDLQGISGTSVSIDVSSGMYLIMNAVDGCTLDFNFRGGELELDDSCTGGDFYAEGVAELYGDPIALGMNVKGNNLISNSTIAAQVWDTTLSEHIISGSTGEELASGGSFTGNTEEIAIAVWNMLSSSGNTDGSFGVLLNDLIIKANESQHTLNVQTEMLKNKPNNC